MDSEDKMWIKKYPSFIVNKILSGFQDTLMLVNEMNRCHFLAGIEENIPGCLTVHLIKEMEILSFLECELSLSM